MSLTHDQVALLDGFIADGKTMKIKELAEKHDVKPSNITGFRTVLKNFGVDTGRVAKPKTAKAVRVPVDDYAKFKEWQAQQEAKTPHQADSHAPPHAPPHAHAA